MATVVKLLIYHSLVIYQMALTAAEPEFQAYWWIFHYFAYSTEHMECDCLRVFEIQDTKEKTHNPGIRFDREV